MGIIGDAVSGLIKGAAFDAGIEAADKGLEAGSKATGAISRKISNVKDNRNMSKLRKEAKKEDYCLFVECKNELGEGIYQITTKKKEDKYNTLMDHLDNDAFILHLYHYLKGEIGSVKKAVTMKKGVFSSKPIAVNYLLQINDQILGEVFQAKEGKEVVYKNNFNDWVATGDFKKGNYKIFSKTTGKTMASISKRIAAADTYLITCEYDRNEPIIVAISLLINMLNRR